MSHLIRQGTPGSITTPIHKARRLVAATLPLVIVAFFAATARLEAGDASQPRRSHPRLAAEFEAMRLRDENGVIASNGLLNAMERARQMKYDPAAWPGAAKPKTDGPKPKVADLSTNNWEWLGPGNIGGRIRAIAVHPTNSSILWVGGVTGGVWKSTNSAASFFPVDDWLSSLAITDIKVDPIDPNVLYASTGEDVRGAGIFKSVDGGNTWSRLPTTSYATQGDVFRLSISPANHLNVLAISANGIWRSTDGGANWTQTYANGVTARRGRVVFHPTDGMKAVAMGNGTTRALYSTDGGVTWNAATGLPTSGRVELSYAPSSPNIVYALQDFNGGTLYASTDGGVSYAQRASATNLLVQGDWDSVVWVDPTNPNVVFIGGVDLWRSTDAGTNFTKVSSWGANQIAQRNDQFSSAHADHHVIIAHPNFDPVTNAFVYEGNDGGLFAITNIYNVSETSSDWTNLNHHLGITQFYGGAGSPTTFTVQGGGQDNGHARGKAGEWTDRWHLFKGGDGGFCAVDPTDSRIFYGEYIYLTIARSTDEGQNGDSIYDGLPEAGVPPPWIDDPDLKPDDPDVPAHANFIAPFILDPNNPNTMLAGASNLWRSLNIKTPVAANVTWSICFSNPGNGTFVSAIAVQQGNSDVIWVGYNNGDVYATANGTAVSPTWTRKDLGAPNLPNRQCLRLAIDATNPNIVYATFGGFNSDNVYRTSDGGANWSVISSALPAAPINTIVIAPWNHNYLYVGTHVGIFGSTNAGATWSPANEGPASVRTDELFWLRNYLHAATYGRGMFRIALGPPTVAIAPTAITTYISSNATFTASPIGAPALTLQWQYDGTNITGATNVTLTLTNLQPENSGRYSVIASSAQGSASATATLTVVDSPPYRSQALATSPTVYWRLNETSGTTAHDSVGSYHGTSSSGVVPGTNGPGAPAFPGLESGNTAYQFNGDNARIAVPALSLNSTSITIIAWVKRNGSQGYYPGIVSWSSGGTTIHFGFGDNNNRLTYVRNGSVYSSSSLVVPDNQWTFVAIVITETNAVLYMATNATPTSVTVSRTDTPAAVFTNTAYIGYSPYGGYNFTGTLDEIALFNQSLTPSQITNLIVSATTALPTVALTAPADGSGYLAPTTINLAASVTANGHTINKVQFYSSTSLLAEDTTPPYEYTFSSVSHGVYTLLAKVVYDGSGVASSLPANVFMTNLPPIALADSTNVYQNSSVTVNVLANDTDANSYALSLQSFIQPDHGTTALSGTNILYTPNANYYGTDTFSYTISDGHFDTASATVTVTVNPLPNTAGILSSALRTNLVAYLPFDDDFYDYSTRGNHPGQSNVNLRAAGNLGANGYVLTNGGYLSFGLAEDLHFANDTVGNTNSFSISFWAKIPPGSFSGAPPYVANKDWVSDANTGWALAAGSNTGGNGFFQMSFKESNANLREYDSSNTALTNGNWHHYLVVFQRDGTRTCFTYIDGALADSRAMFASGVNIDGAGLLLNIGQDGTGTGSRGTWTNALMDDFAFWRRALTSTEVTAIYSAGTNGIALAYAESAPVITNLTASRFVPYGSSISVTVGVVSATAVGYQWRLNGTPISGATSATYTKATPVVADLGNYDVVVSNVYGTNISAAIVMTNRAPVAGAVTLAASQNQTAVLGTAKVLYRASDADSDSLMVASVTSTSTNGGAVSLTETNTILYTPVASFVGIDQLSYTISDGFRSVNGTVAITVSAVGLSLNIVSPPTLLGNGHFHVGFAGIPNYIYRVDRATDPNGPWEIGFTNITVGANGLFELDDPNEPSAPQRFYRTVVP